MDKSVTSYSQNLVEIDDLRNKLSRLESLLQKRRANDFSRKQYSLLMARDKGLLGDFLATWKEDDKFNQAYIDGSKKNISAAFDEMISTESARKK